MLRACYELTAISGRVARGLCCSGFDYREYTAGSERKYAITASASAWLIW